MAASSAGSKPAPGAYSSPENFADHVDELLVLEQEAEVEETTELLQSLPHSELQARGLAVLKLTVGEHSTALYGRALLTFERPKGELLPSHRLTTGDIVGVFDQATRPLSKAVPLASGVLQRARPGSIALAFDGEVPPDILDGRQLHLAAVSSEVTLTRYREVLAAIRSGRLDGPAADLLSLCFASGDQVRPRFREKKSEDCGRPDAVDCTFLSEPSSRLNAPQQVAVERALCAQDMMIIHGPPGTGKTTTVVAYILEAAYRKQRLLVTAPSNVAVDNLLERVVAAGFRSVVRIGHPARVQTDLHRYTMDSVVYESDQGGLCRDIKKEIDDALKKSSRGGTSKGKDDSKKARAAELTALRKELRSRERRAVAEVLRYTQVVFATCAGAATVQREVRKAGAAAGGGSSAELSFDVVVIDEAAQALEVSCWIPLLMGRKAVLAGDHQQLAACVKSMQAQKKGLDHTLFARMIERHGDEVSSLLSTQYRMNATIMGWSSRTFYEARLEAAEEVAARTLQLTERPALNLLGTVLEAMQAPLLFVDTGGLAEFREEDAAGADEKGRGRGGASISAALHQSRANFGESRFLVHYAKLLVKCGLKPQDLTVITPYNRQVERLREEFAEDAECSSLELEKPRVNTVDSFQGQEADAVLISLVRSNERSSVGFLADYRRLNVAVTRARKHVMIVGDAATISSDKTLSSLYDYACEHGTVMFVRQLLDEEGQVPPDPSAVPAESLQEPRAKRLLQAGQKAGQAGAEEDRRRSEKFRAQLLALKEAGGHLELPRTLNSFERAVCHEIATELGLLHESRGEGAERRLVVWTEGHEVPQAAVAGSPSDGGTMPSPAETERKDSRKGKNGTVPAVPKAAASSDVATAEEAGSDSDAEGETALEAFSRRARAILANLDPAQPAAEWKLPGEEELELLRGLAEELGLELDISGSGKKRRCRISLAADQLPPPAPAGPTSSAASAPASNGNDVLRELQAAKQRRQLAEAERRKADNEAAKAELKTAKKKASAAAPKGSKQDGEAGDDLDALLSEFTAADNKCFFCQAKLPLGCEAISLCRHCGKRYCLTHMQPEKHGCGDAVRHEAQKQFKDMATSGARGSGLSGKAVGNREGARKALAGKLQEKIKDQEGNRATKKPEKKT